MEATRIKALRKAMKLTLARFATKLNVCYTTVCLWESAKFQPSVKNLQKLEELGKQHGI
mgnify:CR=1 FL=1